MNIVLINPNTVKPPLSPIGILYLSAYLKSKEIEVEVIDLGNECDLPSALTRAAKNRPALAGISIRNIDSAQRGQSRYFLPEALAVVKAVKAALPRTPVVLGGAGFSIAPLEIMKVSRADYGVVGEGEAALYELITKLETGADVSSIAGLVYKTPAGSCLANPLRNSGADFLRSLPFQDIDAVDYRSYYDLGGMASIQTKRGCALRCNYCTYPLIEGGRYRLFSPGRVVDEMEFLVSRGYDYFHFADSIFNAPRQHALEVCREIARRRLPVRWHAYMSPLGFDQELADCIRQAGNDGVQLGLDTCSEKMLREMGKNFAKKDIARAVAACRDRGLDCALNILFGSPGETMETVEETLQALDDLRPTAAFLTQGIRVYRNTPIYWRLVKEGKLQQNQSLLEPYFYLSEALAPDFPARLHRYALARDFVFSDTTAKSPSTNQEVMALYKNGFRGPCWRVLWELRALPKKG